MRHIGFNLYSYFFNLIVYFAIIHRQSDGAAPHIINIHLKKKTNVSYLCFYCDYNLDESYTVKKISIRHGTTLHDLVDLTVLGK